MENPWEPDDIYPIVRHIAYSPDAHLVYSTVVIVANISRCFALLTDWPKKKKSHLHLEHHF